MFYFYTNELHFSPEFLGRVRLAGSIASLAGEVVRRRVDGWVVHGLGGDKGEGIAGRAAMFRTLRLSMCVVFLNQGEEHRTP